MDIQVIMALVGATAILALVPGPVVAALVGRALLGGVRSTIGFLAGVFVADLVWLAAAVSGLGYIAATYATLFMVIKYLGALYLLYLGVQACREAMRRQHAIEIPKTKFKGAGFLSGLLVTLGNPKLVAFYIGFLPTFIDMQSLSIQEALVTAVLVPSTFAIINFGWALSASKARQVLRAEGPQRIMNFLSGGFLIGAGTVLMVED